MIYAGNPIPGRRIFHPERLKLLTLAPVNFPYCDSFCPWPILQGTNQNSYCDTGDDITGCGIILHTQRIVILKWHNSGTGEYLQGRAALIGVPLNDLVP